MGKTVPLIRAANVLPLVRFLEANRRDAEVYLDAADLSYWFALSPLDAIPLRNGIELLTNIARSDGPDVGARIVSQASLFELAYIGQVALGARTPAEAMQRVSMALPLHSSHEQMRVDQSGGFVMVSQRLSFAIEPEALHAVHVLFCAMMQQLCRFSGFRPPQLSQISAAPHPAVGVADMVEHFRCPVAESADGTLEIAIASRVAKVPFQAVARDRLATATARAIPPLAEDTTLAGSVRPVISAMLHASEPTVERVARAGGMSVRSMQRRLSEEGTSFSKELDCVRRRLARSLLQSDDLSLSDLTQRLGYSSPQALSRAVRRMVGASPSGVRQRSG